MEILPFKPIACEALDALRKADSYFDRSLAYRQGVKRARTLKALVHISNAHLHMA